MKELREALDRFAVALPMVERTNMDGGPAYVDDAQLLVDAARKYADIQEALTDGSAYVPTWRGRWDDTEPPDWEEWELRAYGKEAGDQRRATMSDLRAAVDAAVEEKP